MSDMKAMPVIADKELGWKQVTKEEATHVQLHFPGPSGIITLPVIQKGQRKGTGCWSWDGNTSKPTLKPSVRTEGTLRDGTTTKFLCHSFVNDGVVKFLNDSTHSLAGQDVELITM